MVFANNQPQTSWIFATVGPTSQTDWRNLTPALQIKHQKVVINKLIPNGEEASYSLDVNGSANATTITVNTHATMQYNSNEDCLDFIFN